MLFPKLTILMHMQVVIAAQGQMQIEDFLRERAKLHSSGSLKHRIWGAMPSEAIVIGCLV